MCTVKKSDFKKSLTQEKKGLSLRLKPTQSLQTPTLHSLSRHLPYVMLVWKPRPFAC